MVEHHVNNGVAVLHFKLTDCFILHDAMTVKNELEAGTIKHQPDTSHNMAEVLGKNPLDGRVILGRNHMEGITPWSNPLSNSLK